VHRKVRRHGVPLQYSVFLVHTNMPGLLELRDDLQTLVDGQVDDVRRASRRPLVLALARRSP
jgi:hypothetical protein